MKTKFILFARYLLRFGIVNGAFAFFRNRVLASGESKVVLSTLDRPFYLRRGTSDLIVFDKIFIYREYDFHISFKPQFVLDCGANIGLSTIFFANKYPSAKIVAIEPEHSNFVMLEKNTGAYDNIVCLEKGVWKRAAILKIEDSHSLGKWGFICKETLTEDESTVQAISIGDVMRHHQVAEIDILKLDIEGSEMELFQQGYELWLPKIKVIIIELHDWFRTGCSKAFFSALVKYDFSVSVKGENIICVRNDSL